MKKWTVMVIPQGQGTTKTLHVSSAHVWMLWTSVAVLVALTFFTTFFYRRYQVAQSEAATLRQEQLETAYAEGASSAPEALSAEERSQIERQIREEYERRNAAIVAELSQLYELEAQVRTIHGLPPRNTIQGGGAPAGGGRGGGPSQLEKFANASFTEVVQPPSIMYGIANPSADLSFQEILLRIESFQDLLNSMQDRRDRIEREPSGWPTTHTSRRITSTFGYRKDPLTRALRHHAGTDISAEYGTAVLATAKGTVSFAEYDRYFGNLVKINHGGGIETWYAHMKELSVKKGDKVERGQPIGTVGSTGRSTGAHIHYEVHVNGRPVDSGKYMGIF